MPSNITIFLLLFFLFAFCLSGNGVYAFGAGNIPSFAYMEGRAFRHGDIEDALAELIKRASGGFALTSMLSKGPKFNGLDIKRVYFGNWLRDYSQAVDIASLKKVQLQTIMNLVMVLSFMAHGYATHEFEVTPERLGVYLPTEHIDNPKGYGEGEDPRKYHPNLRGPVDPRELEIDLRTGMKNYIANEQGHWDTSKALVRRTLERCIHLGRQHRARGMKQDEYEAYRLLGQSLHTLEDFSAHSNFCELALVSMGHTDVFVHVGDQVRIQAPGGKWVAPIVTGTFGSSDFTHSLLGEATDHLSEASVSDLNKELDKARSTSQANASRGGAGSGPNGPAELLREMFFAIPGGEGSEMSRELDSVQQIRAGAAQGGKRPEDMSPQELHAVLWQVLTFRDSVVKKISKTIEKIPGLGPLIDKLMDSISVFVFTTLEPFLKPLLKSATSGLQEVSGEVINTHDQYEVFNDPRASDPTHSFLSKDHFNLILNEPAGQLARMVLVHTVTWVIKAWDDTSVNVQAATEDILQCLFHPDFHNPSSKIQKDMLQCMHNWVQGLGNRQRSTLSRLTKNAVRNHENVRAKGEGGPAPAESSFAANQAHQFQHDLQGYASGIPVLGQAQAFLSGGDGKHSGKKDKKDDKKGDKKDDKKHDKKDDKKHDKKDDKKHDKKDDKKHDKKDDKKHGDGKHTRDTSGGAPGEASSYYSNTAAAAAMPSFPSYGGGAAYAPPPGPPPTSGGYAPPSGPPPGSFPSAHTGYAPAYGSAPTFPSAAPSFPGSGEKSAAPAFPGAPPAFPGSGGSEQPGMGFPGTGPGYGYGGEGGYGAPSGYGAPPQEPGFPGAPPAFPGAPGGYPPYGGQGQGQGQGGGW